MKEEKELVGEAEEVMKEQVEEVEEVEEVGEVGKAEEVMKEQVGKAEEVMKEQVGEAEEVECYLKVLFEVWIVNQYYSFYYVY